MTAQRNDGHFQWPNDYEAQRSAYARNVMTFGWLVPNDSCLVVKILAFPADERQARVDCVSVYT